LAAYGSGAPGIGDLFQRLADEGRAVVRAEARQFRAIEFDRADRARTPIAIIMTGGAIALAALVALLIGLVIALAPRFGPAVAGAIVALPAFAAAGLIWICGTRLLTEALLAPEEKIAPKRSRLSAATIAKARAEAADARRAILMTLGALQERLRPAALANDAWEEVKERSGELADEAIDAVKARPVAVSAALAGFALYLARSPIRSAISRLAPRGRDDDNKADTKPISAAANPKAPAKAAAAKKPPRRRKPKTKGARP